MLDLYLISILAFFAILGIWIYKDRKKIDIISHIIVIRKTKRFRDSIDRIARKSPKFWKAISTIAILVCICCMAFGTYIVLMNSYNIFTGIQTESGLKLILPSTSSAGSSGEFYIGIPFWFWIIIIISILVPHELSHGIIARAEKIRLKSVGLLLLLVLPGAFVETDEKQLKKAKTLTRLRVFAAGSGANLLVAALVFLLVSFIIWPLGTASGLMLMGVNATSPANSAGLAEGMTMTHVNGQEITTTYKEYRTGTGYLSEEFAGISPGDRISVTADGKEYDVTLGSNGDKPYMGIMIRPVYTMSAYAFAGVIVPLLTLIWYLSMAVAIFNILPLYPLDGGLMVEAIADKFTKKKAKMITKYISIIILLLIVYNFIGPSL